jgi:hypothetical protein
MGTIPLKTITTISGWRGRVGIVFLDEGGASLRLSEYKSWAGIFNNRCLDGGRLTPSEFFEKRRRLTLIPSR